MRVSQVRLLRGLSGMFARAIDKRARNLGRLTERTRLCEACGKARAETGQRLCDPTGWSPWPVATEYERARARVERLSRRELLAVGALRLLTLNPDLVRASQQLKKLRRCCALCPAINLQRVRNGESFECLVNGNVQASPFRYQLNEKGQIIG